MSASDISNLYTLTAGIGGALVGVFVGTYISTHLDKKRENKEVQRVRELIREDYRRIDQILIQAILSVQDILESLESNDELIQKIMDKKKDHTFPDEMGNAIVVPLKLSFWNAINQSGTLIKLEPSEIRIFQTYQDSSEQFSEYYFDFYKKITALIREINVDENKSTEKKKDEIREIVKPYLKSLCESYERIWDDIQSTSKKISWLTLIEMKSSDSAEKIVDKKGTYYEIPVDLRKYVKLKEFTNSES